MINKKIKEVSKELKVANSTIQYYEDFGLLKPDRTDGNYRNFSEEDILKLKMILLLKDSGFALKEIKVLMDEYTKDICSDCDNAFGLIEKKISSLEVQMDKTREYISLLHKLIYLLDDSESKKSELINFIEKLFEKYKITS